MSEHQEETKYPDGLTETVAQVAGEGGTKTVPALVHESCPGLAVTMFPFGLFSVSHIKTGRRLTSPSERASTALLTMSQFELVARLKDESWEDMDQSGAAKLIKDADSDEVPFDGYTSTSNKGTRKMTVGEWFQAVRFTFPGEFPWEERDPFEMAFENFEKMEAVS
ncbi:hypothetical protein [Marinobacter salarius]|uniref:hypothetical protein n=1 Tax=Marinobacter salarius TaxID=1420917 RepID=UPI003D098BBF